jgi:hypothetical protein
VKPPQSPASAFPWHRDSDWLDDGAVTRHPYISVRSVILPFLHFCNNRLVSATSRGQVRDHCRVYKEKDAQERMPLVCRCGAHCMTQQKVRRRPYCRALPLLMRCAQLDMLVCGPVSGLLLLHMQAMVHWWSVATDMHRQGPLTSNRTPWRSPLERR